MKGRQLPLVICSFFLSLVIISCYRMRSPNGGGQIKNLPERAINGNDIGLHPGYTIEPLVSGLTFPTAVTFDDDNTMYVIESGYSTLIYTF